MNELILTAQTEAINAAKSYEQIQTLVKSTLQLTLYSHDR